MDRYGSPPFPFTHMVAAMGLAQQAMSSETDRPSNVIQGPGDAHQDQADRCVPPFAFDHSTPLRHVPVS